MKPIFIVAAAALVGLAVSRSQPNLLAQSGGCEPAGGLNFVCGIDRPEDIVAIPNTRSLLTGGTTSEGGGLHLVDTQAKTYRNLYAAGAASVRADRTKYARCPGPLDPKTARMAGLSLRPAPGGRYTVYASNHSDRSSIEVFELDVTGVTPTATWVGCLVMPENLSANSVAAFKDGTVVVTVFTFPGKTTIDLIAGRNTGAVYMWAAGGTEFQRLPGTDLPGNNGIETSSDDQEFYVVSTGLKQIVAYSRKNPSAPPRRAQLPAITPDNVRMTNNGLMIIAGMPDDVPACGGAPKTPEDWRCPRGYVIATIDPKTMAVTEVVRGPAIKSFTGPTIAAKVGDQWWMGTFLGDRLAYRTVNQ